MAKKVCDKCDKPSAPGLISSVGLCQYHYDVRMFGKEWADDVERRRILTPSTLTTSNGASIETQSRQPRPR